MMHIQGMAEHKQFLAVVMPAKTFFCSALVRHGRTKGILMQAWVSMGSSWAGEGFGHWLLEELWHPGPHQASH